MSLSRWFYWLFACSLVVLVCILCWSSLVLYEAEIKRVHQSFDVVVNKTAEGAQAKNMTLNNLAKAFDDPDYSDKIAFAIGMTQNQGKMSMDISDSNHSQLTTNDTGIRIDRAFVKKEKAVFKPGAVFTIKKFDSALKLAIVQAELNLPYHIQTVSPHKLDPAPHASRLFIINFHDPLVYRVVYQLPPPFLLKRMMPFMGAGLLLLLLFTAGFILYHKSYRMQAQMSQFKESLLSNFTHELKTPVASLQLFMDMLKKNSTTTAQDKEYISLANTELNRIKLLTERILSFGNLNAEEFSLNKEVLSIADVVTEAVTAMMPTINTYGAQVAFSPNVNPEVMGDRMLLVNMLTSIIDNALKYNKNKPALQIKMEETDKHVHITLKDNGIGITKPMLRKIFEPFFRIPEGNLHNTKGHGLGLSFAKQAVLLHNGKIRAERNSETGTSIIITLPRL